jgi:glycosyltransferase involved in cell wall biosynthesis
MAADLANQSVVGKASIHVLPNPVDIDAIRSFPCQNGYHARGPGPHLLAIGRLAPEKGFDLLLEALSSLRARFPDAALTILGEGPARASLQQQCRDLQIQDAVRFAGYVTRPERYFSPATLFVSSSRYEGMPNALLEAAAAGLPIAALPSAEGLVHLLQGKPGIWMAPEISASALTHSLLTALEALRPGERFPHPWVEQFRLDHAIREYERVIDATLEAARP